MEVAPTRRREPGRRVVEVRVGAVLGVGLEDPVVLG
jgi:hypothetical protein